MDKVILSIIVPIFNGVNNIEPLIKSVQRAVDNRRYPYELIFVNSGSTDGSTAKLQLFNTRLSWVRIANVSINRGEHSALISGLVIAKGKYIFIVQDDMYKHIIQLYRFIEMLEQGYDIVLGYRVSRYYVSVTQRRISKLLNAYYSRMFRLKIRDFGCGFRAFKRKVLENNNGIYFEIIKNMSQYQYAELPLFDNSHMQNSRYTLRRKVILFCSILFFPLKTFLLKDRKHIKANDANTTF
jgi:glycosyltransferase involved in cell wall biosynthesis